MKLTSTLFIATIIFSSYTFSQAPTQQWNADFGGDNNESFATLQQTKDGGYIAGGYSESGISGDKTQASQAAVITGL